MKGRWVIVAVGAVVLIVASFVVSRMMGRSGFDAKAGGSSQCDPKSKPADLSFVIKDMDGKEVRLSDYKGKVVMLNFWATWCGPCKIEIPTFVALQEKYRDKGVAFLGLSVDDPVDKLKPFAQEYKINYPVLVGQGRDEIQDAYGPIWGIPMTVLISRDGKICKRFMGLANTDDFERELKALL